VTFQQTPFNEYWKSILTDVAIGNPPDVFQMNNFYWQQFIDEGVPLDLTPTVALLDTPGTNMDEYIPSIVEAASREGKLYAIPRGINSSAFVVNVTLFEEAGVELPPTSPEDWTWNDFKEIARKMTDPDQKRFGAWILYHASWTPTFLLSNGGRFLDPETHSRAQGYMDSEANAEYVEWYKSMVEEGIMPEPGALDAFGGSTGAMLGGNLALTHTDGFHQVHWAKVEEVPYEWAGAKNPKPGEKPLKPHIAIHGMMVPKGVKDVLLATELAGYVAWGDNTEMENPVKISPLKEYAQKQVEGDFAYFRPIYDQALAENVELHEGALTRHMDILFEEWLEMFERVLLEDMPAIESLQIAAKNFDERVAEKEA
jgi:multiple sugar transport system substrate-binding protein